MTSAHVVLLTNFIPPYRLPVYTELANRVGRLTVLLSTPMEANRQWSPDWGPLEVLVQRTLTVRRRWRHDAGFEDTGYVHFPWDTLGRLRSLKPDVVISAELGYRSCFSALHTLRRRVPLVLWGTLSDHTERHRGWPRHLLRRWLARQADAIVVNGRSGARYLERVGFARDKIFLLPQPAMPGFEGLPLDRPATAAHRLVYAGQLIERKGLVPFTRSLRRWAEAHPDRQVEFVLAGSGPVRAELESLALPPNLSLKFLGETSYADLAAVYADTGIFAFPTLADEWGLVVNEALAAGLPVLGSVYSQAVEELCREAENGWTFRPNDAEMDAAIDRAMSTSVGRLNEMRIAGRQSVEHLTPRYGIDCLMRAMDAAAGERKNLGVRS
jgi:glycosyltransferase involved in cell wall biosynthesis